MKQGDTQGDTGVQGDTGPHEPPAPTNAGEFRTRMRKITITTYAHEDEIEMLQDTIEEWWLTNEVALYKKLVDVDPVSEDDLSLPEVEEAWEVLDPMSFDESLIT